MTRLALVIAGLAILLLQSCATGTGLVGALGLARADYLAIDLRTGLVLPLDGIPDLNDSTWRTSQLLMKAITDQPSLAIDADPWAAPGEATRLPASSRTFIAVYELTQAQWLLLGGQPAWRAIRPDADADGNELPATGLSLTAARAVLASASLRMIGSLSVPDDDIWEMACRGGASGRFIWGALPVPAVAAAYAVTGDTAPGRTGPTRVGLRQPNAFGLYDIMGNAAELTEGGNLRGGAWADPLPAIRPSARRAIDAASAHRLGGLRPIYRPEGG